MSKITLDETRWPLIEVSYPDAFDMDEWANLLERLVKIIRRDVPFAMLNDARDAPPPNAQQRQMITRMYRDHLELVRKNWLGTALVTDSAMARGIVAALQWLMPMPHPFRVFTNYAEGEAWAMNRLREARPP